MLEENQQICLTILNKLKSDESSYNFFKAPAMTALGAEDQETYKKMIPESDHRDLEMIRANLLDAKYSAMASFRDDGK